MSTESNWRGRRRWDPGSRLVTLGNSSRFFLLPNYFFEEKEEEDKDDEGQKENEPKKPGHGSEEDV
jgi:hypothetical protein